MNKVTHMEKLADIQRMVSKLERLPDSARWYVLGYAEGAADASAQAHTGERREGA